MSKFGFQVIQKRGGWAVCLPHQCQQWGIAPLNWDDYEDGISHDEAVELMEEFVLEAQWALGRLRDERPTT